LAEKSVTKQTHTKTKKKTVKDVSTPCLSACVDNKVRAVARKLTYKENIKNE